LKNCMVGFKMLTFANNSVKRRRNMNVRKFLKVRTLAAISALFLASSPAILTGCGGGGGGGAAVGGNQTQPQQPTVATVTGNVPEDLQLASDADVRAPISGVRDIIAICDGTAIDGHFTDNGTKFTVNIPVNTTCKIAFIDRAVTGGQDVPDNATILAITPPITATGANVAITINSITDGVADITATGADVDTSTDVSGLVGQTVAEAQGGAGGAGGGNATAGTAAGNVDTGWLTTRVVGYGIDKVLKLKDKDGNEAGIGFEVTNAVKSGSFIFVSNGTSIKAIEETSSGDILREVSISSGGSTVTPSDVKFGESVVWVKDTSWYVASLSNAQVNSDGKVALTAYKLTSTVPSGAKVVGDELVAKSGNKVLRAWLDENSVKTATIEAAAVDYVKDANGKGVVTEIMALADNATDIKVNGSADVTHSSPGKLALYQWDGTQKQFSKVGSYDLKNLFTQDQDNATSVIALNTVGDYYLAILQVDNGTANADLVSLSSDFSSAKKLLLADNVTSVSSAIFAPTSSSSEVIIAKFGNATKDVLDFVSVADNGSLSSSASKAGNYTASYSIENSTEVIADPENSGVVVVNVNNGTNTDAFVVAKAPGSNVFVFNDTGESLSSYLGGGNWTFDGFASSSNIGWAHNGTTVARVSVTQDSGFTGKKTVMFGNSVTNLDIVDANRTIASNSTQAALLVYSGTGLTKKKYNGHEVTTNLKDSGGNTEIVKYQVDDTPYFNRLQYTDFDNTLNATFKLSYLFDNSTVAYINTAGEHDAQYVTRLLKNKTITKIFAAGSNIYAVDSDGNLHIIQRDDSGTFSEVGSKVLSDIHDVTATTDGSSIYVASTGGFIYVLDSSGNTVDSFRVKVTKQVDSSLNTVDDAVNLSGIQVAFAGDYLYVLGKAVNVATYAGSSTTNKAYVYILVYSVNNDGTVNHTPVGAVKVVETSQSPGSAAIHFAKVVGSGSNAKLYISYTTGGTRVAEVYGLSNPTAPSKERERELSDENCGYAFSSQAIIAYDSNATNNDASIRKYTLPNLTPTVTKDIADSKYGYIINGDIHGVFGFGNYLFAVDGNDTAGNKRIVILDITDMNNIRLAGDVNLEDVGLTASGDNATNLLVKAIGDNTYLYIATKSDGLVIYNLNSATVQ